VAALPEAEWPRHRSEKQKKLKPFLATVGKFKNQIIFYFLILKTRLSSNCK
jgi:hypothetical protein